MSSEKIEGFIPEPELSIDQINDLASMAFGLPIDMTSRANSWDRLITRTNPETRQIAAFGAYILVSIDSVTRILYEDLKVVSPAVQGQGLGAAITEQAVKSVLDERTDLFVLARTQNGHEFKSFKKGVRKIDPNCQVAPVDCEPSELQVQILESFLTVHPAKRGEVDIANFIHRRAYKTFPDMTVSIQDGGGDAIKTFLGRHGCSTSSGDAVYIMTAKVGGNI